VAKILIVEDEAQLAEAYAFLLRHAGHKVAVAQDGQDGLVKVAKAKPDLIVLDMMMPHLNGIGFLERYKDQRPKGVKIILLSNMQSPEYQAQAYALGVDYYAIKASLSPDQLLSLIKEALAV
jgi:two-component system chemotaxis response regulator CheY